MRGFLSKRGEISLVLSVIVELIFVAALGVVFFSFNSQITSNELFERTYIAYDTSLLLDAVYASPGRLELNYKRDVTNQNISIRDGFVDVSKKGQLNSDVYITYRYAYSDKTKLETSDLEFFDDKKVNYLLKQNRALISINNIESEDVDNKVKTCANIDPNLKNIYEKKEILVNRFVDHFNSKKDMYKDAYTLVSLVNSGGFASIDSSSEFSKLDFDKLQKELNSDKYKVFIMFVKNKDIEGIKVISKEHNSIYKNFNCRIDSLAKEINFEEDYGFKNQYSKYKDLTVDYAIIVEYNVENIFGLSNDMKKVITEVFNDN